MSYEGNWTMVVDPRTNDNQDHCCGGPVVGPVIIVVLFGICIASIPCILHCLCHGSNEANSQEQILNDESPDAANDTIRMEFIRSNLPYRVAEAGGEESKYFPVRSDDGWKMQGSSGRRSVGVDRTIKIVKAEEPSRNSPIPVPVCSICLSSYHVGDVVSWSTNPSCEHEYHRTCIQDWLVSHSDCPLCRCVFLLSDPKTMVPPPHCDATVDSSVAYGEDASFDQSTSSIAPADGVMEL